MGFSDLLEFSLDLLDGFVLQVLNFLESTLDHTQSLWVYLGRSQELVDLSILSLKTLLDGFKFLFQNQISETCFLVELVNRAMELIEKLLLFSHQVLELL
jgi:hypothetical protein